MTLHHMILALFILLTNTLLSQTTLNRGDLLILGVNANRNGCDGATEGRDEISFVCFKDITTGTTIDFTDNGYERCNPNQWGDTEGTIRATRTGGTILAGTVITFRFDGNGHTEHTGVSPDANWSFSSLNGATNYFNLNNGGDQVYMMQGGTWSNPGGTHDATYTPGSAILFGFSTNGAWSASCTTNPTQHSNKFPGMECFFSNPTSSTDFSKYCGPITPASQREWIDRVNNPSNWCSYSSCSNYSTSGYNFAGGYTIDINPGGFNAGVWVGDASTDWFNCENWQNKSIPVATTNVTIDQSALNNCVIGGTGAAVCNNLSLSSNSSTNRNLTIQNTATLTAGGNIIINKSAGGGDLVFELLNSAQLTCQNITMQGTNPSSENGILLIESSNAVATINGNLTINTGGNLDMSDGSFGSPEGNLYLHGNWVNNEPETSFKQGESTIRFVGSGNQTIDVGGSSPERFWNLIVNKTGGVIILNDPIEVGGSSGDAIVNRNGVLTLTNRNIETGTHYLYVTNAALGGISGGSSDSFVDGNLRRHTNTDNLYDFPVGEGTRYMRAGVRTTNTSENVIEVDAQNSGYGTYSPLEPLPLGLVYVSIFRWWDITKISGTTPVNVRLYWMALEDDNIVDATKLVVAHWSDRDHFGSVSTTQWWNRGRNAANSTGTIANGFVESSETVAHYSPFTFGTIDPINPLPVSLISFTGSCDGDVVNLKWITASETDNVLFSVHRSEDGMHFSELSTISGAGVSAVSDVIKTYHYQDLNPTSNSLYYRLVYIDSKGNKEISIPILVECKKGIKSDDEVKIWFTHANQALIQLQAENDFVLHMQLMDLTGRILFVKKYQVNAGVDVVTIDLDEYKSGIYLLNLQDGLSTKTFRLLKP
ncbi:MAG: T9SS type A sorting domain-containing protein [Cytophagaceae bacterium]|nr:T9SS type A sorting domain-containing protein [Cytophagaceae bacterium]MDW8456461.1 T9SS type A sorting domain-containing protein [Cytophagaceae bacterium]